MLCLETDQPHAGGNGKDAEGDQSGGQDGPDVRRKPPVREHPSYQERDARKGREKEQTRRRRDESRQRKSRRLPGEEQDERTRKGAGLPFGGGREARTGRPRFGERPALPQFIASSMAYSSMIPSLKRAWSAISKVCMP